MNSPEGGGSIKPTRIPPLACKLLGAGLIAAGMALECASCYRPILRDGNEPVASMLALVGLLAIACGAALIRSLTEAATQKQRIRMRLLVEHLSYSSVLGILWLLFERDTFFTDTPWGADILPAFRLLLATLTAVLILSILGRAALHIPGERSRRALLPLAPISWKTSAAVLVFLALLNVVQAQETVRVGDALRISIRSRGFPLPAFQTMETTPLATPPVDSTEPIVNNLTMPDGTAVSYIGDSITVLRNSRMPKQLAQGERVVMLADHSRIEFQKAGGGATIALHGRGSFTVSPAWPAAAFQNGLRHRTNVQGLLIDLVFALLVAIHAAVSVERLQPPLATRMG